MARELLSVSSISINDLNDAVVSGTAPSNPDEGMLWLNEKVLKQYTNGTWQTVTLDISKMDEVLAETIRSMEETLGNISNDGILTFIDRQTIASNVGSIIGEMPSTSAKAMAVLPSYTALDSKGIGTFAFLRHTARDIGMDEESSFFKEMQDTYTNLVSYISSTTPKMWDITTANKDKVITLSDKDTFNGYWLNYFLAEASMSGEIDRLANIKLEEMTKGSSVQDKDESTGEGIAFTNNGDKDGRVYPTLTGANFPKIGYTGKNLFNVREFVASGANSSYYALYNNRFEEDDVLAIKSIDGRGFDNFDYDIPVKPSTTYTLSHKRPMFLRLAEHNSSGAMINSVATSNELYSHTFKTSSSTSSVRFKFHTNSDKWVRMPQIQLEEGAKATEYEPNISLSYPVTPKQMDNFYLVGARGKENFNDDALNFGYSGTSKKISEDNVDYPEGWEHVGVVKRVKAKVGDSLILTNNSTYSNSSATYMTNREVTESIMVKNNSPFSRIQITDNGRGEGSIWIEPLQEQLVKINGRHRNSYNFTQTQFRASVDIAGRNLIKGTSDSYKSMSTGIWHGAIPGAEVNTLAYFNVNKGDRITYRVYIKGASGNGGKVRITYWTEGTTSYGAVVGELVPGGSEGYSTATMVIPNNVDRIQLSLQPEKAGTSSATLEYKEAKLEKGSTATPWVPAPEDFDYDLDMTVGQHKYELGGYTPYNDALNNISDSEPTTSIVKHKIELSDGLRSLSEGYKDTLYYDYEDSKWKIKRMTGEFKLNGTENYGYTLESSWTGKRSFRMSGYPNGMNEYSSELVSSHFRYSATGDISSSNSVGEFGRNSLKGIRGHNILFVTAHTSVAQFTSWLKAQSDKGTPVTIWYELQEPQIEVLSDELQNKLNNIYTYEGSSYVWTDTPLDPKITATFKSQAYARNKETKDNLDSKLDKDDYNPDDIVAQSVTATWDNYGDMIEGTVSQLTTYESRVETLQTLFSQTQETFNFNFNALTTTVGDNQTANDDNFSKINKFIRFEGGNIILGEDGSSTYLEISKDKITFNNAGSEVAYISNQTMEITHGIFVQTATIAGMRIQRIPGSNNIGFTVIQ